MEITELVFLSHYEPDRVISVSTTRMDLGRVAKHSYDISE